MQKFRIPIICMRLRPSLEISDTTTVSPRPSVFSSSPSFLSPSALRELTVSSTHLSIFIPLFSAYEEISKYWFFVVCLSLLTRM